MGKARGEKASDRAERQLIERIIKGTLPPGRALPGERDLSKELGVARPALREALQRLERDGWVNIQQGKTTQVNDFMRDGNLNVLRGLLKADISLLPNFVPDLMELWSLLSPTYTRAAIENDAEAIVALLYGFEGLADRAEPYTRALWRLHQVLIERCGNPVHGLVLNSFAEFYRRLALHYFDDPGRRAATRAFWDNLYQAAQRGDGKRAANIMRFHMQATRRLWPKLNVSAWLDDPLEEDEGDDDEEDD
jgi:GntR family negative regulator for fad regulon and positive regulator of fabA